MRATLILADAATIAENKLYLMGGGWSAIVRGAPFALAVIIEVPWDLLDEAHSIELCLVDVDGAPVMVGAPPLERPLVVARSFEALRMMAMSAGRPVTHMFTVAFGPGMPLEVGARYQWRLAIDGVEHSDWQVAFDVLDESFAV